MPRPLALLALLAILPGCGGREGEGPIEITYWEKWTKFEGQAAIDTVKAFNQKYEGRIRVDHVQISEIERKLLVAIAGGNPPDVAGSYTFCVYPYADRNALVPLDDYLAEAGITREDYLPVFWDMCHYRGHMWALPTTPATVALHWNKRLFRESARELRDAGLDPERAPRTIEELDRYADVLTRRDEEGNIVQAGFLPQEPGWWDWSWGHWFGGELWDGEDTITADSPGYVRAFQWVADYSKRYGAKDIRKFVGGFGNFSSPQNAFLAGKVAMEVQGVWMHNFIDQYAPGMEVGVAPFPRHEVPPGVDPSDPEMGTTIADADVIVIPRGSRHPDAAWEFIRFVNSREGMEILCLGQRKFSPLRDVSPGFWRRQRHPDYVRFFYRLAHSRFCTYAPKTGVLREFQREMDNAFDKVGNLDASPQEALAEVDQRMQRSLDRDLRRIRLRQEAEPWQLLYPAAAVAAVALAAVATAWAVRRLRRPRPAPRGAPPTL
ncbi:MAG: ABC transporter substrate-binding protein [Candidatus Brocadiia bacterium]